MYYTSCYGLLDNASDCFASKGLQRIEVNIAESVVIHIYNTHLEAGNGAEDQEVRAEQIDEILTQLNGYSQGAPVILMGDFNAKHTLWGETSCSPWGNLVEELIDHNDIVLMNDGSPTRFDLYHNTKSAIDLTICSSSLRLDYMWSVDRDPHGSDHWPIHLRSNINMPSPCLPKWKMSAADWDLYTKSTKIDREVGSFSNACSAYEYLTSVINGGAFKAIPKTSGNPRRPLVPWWVKECAESRRETRRCYHRFRRLPCLPNKIAYCAARAKQKKIFKKARRVLH